MPTLNWIGKEAVINHHDKYRYTRLHTTLIAPSGFPRTSRSAPLISSLKAITSSPSKHSYLTMLVESNASSSIRRTTPVMKLGI